MRRAALQVLALIVFAALALSACAPPSEADGLKNDTDAVVQAGPTGASKQGAAKPPGPRATGDSDSSDQASVIYEAVPGVRTLARCPSCGTPFREGTTVCAECDLSVLPWQHTAVCAECEGGGVCTRCGDDRTCLACAGDGICSRCEGKRKIAGADCVECTGKGRCDECGGDGVRSLRDGDFPAATTVLPGICPTCIDGSGLCRDCGGAGAGAGVGAERVECVTCAGAGECTDCFGTGTCPHDRGDGLCAVCGGSGHEVLNGPPLPPGQRVWSIGRVDEEAIVGRVMAKPAPDVHVRPTDGKTGLLVLVPKLVQPMSYYLAQRDYTSLDDTAGREALSVEAERLGYLALALVEVRRAAGDRKHAARLLNRTRTVEEVLVAHWLTAAEAALAAGDRDVAIQLAQVAANRARDERTAGKARSIARRVRSEIIDEAAQLSATDRARRAEAQRARVVRTIERAHEQLRRGEQRLRAATDAALSVAAVRAAFDEADRAAWAAERLIGSDAQRLPPTEVTWPAAPVTLMAQARALRASITVARATAAIHGGHFRYGARLARRAVALGADEVLVAAIVRDAQLGMTRQGVDRWPPAPEEK